MSLSNNLSITGTKKEHSLAALGRPESQPSRVGAQGETVMHPKPTKSAPPRLLANGQADRSASGGHDDRAATSLALLAAALPAFARRPAR